MSMNDTNVQAEEIPEIISDEIGQDISGEEVGEAPEAELQFFDWDGEVGEQNVKLTVDGEEVVLSLKEALAGSMRQADYTKKTQQIGEERRQVQYGAALQEALQNDPRKTLELLQQHYGTTQQISEEEDLYADPAELKFRQLAARIEAFELKDAQNSLQRTVELLATKYGTDFDANEVVSRALAVGSSDLEAIFKQTMFDKVYTEGIESRAKVSKTATDLKLSTEAKRVAAVVSGGGTSKTATVSSSPITSLKDAFAAAQRDLSRL